MLDVEAALAAALKLRGHRVHAVMCDGAAKACVRREIKINPDIQAWAQECASCKKDYEARLNAFDLDYSYVGDFVPPQRVAELRALADAVTWEHLPDFTHHGVNIGGNIKSSILRYLKGSDYNGEKELLREYALTGLVTLEAARNAVAKHKPTNVFMSHGIYADWGPALRYALDMRLKVTCWIAAYLHARFYFRHPTDYANLNFHSIDDARWAKEKTPLEAPEADRLDDYFTRRYVRGQSFDVKEFKKYKGSTDALRSRIGFGNDRKTWGIFAHVNWDCVTDYAPMLFDDFNQWIVLTLKQLEQDKSVNWLLKVHPAEAWDNPATGIQALVRSRFSKLPDHIRILGYDEDVNPLDFYNLIDGAITVYGTAGLELARLGKPVIVAGRAHYSRKGFTHDPESREQYFGMLRAASSFGPLPREQQELAMRYAYIYFIQRQIPFPPVRNRAGASESSFWSFDIRSRGMLLPNGDPHVDFIVERILDGQEFILPVELVPSE